MFSGSSEWSSIASSTWPLISFVENLVQDLLDPYPHLLDNAPLLTGVAKTLNSFGPYKRGVWPE